MIEAEFRSLHQRPATVTPDGLAATRKNPWAPECAIGLAGVKVAVPADGAVFAALRVVTTVCTQMFLITCQRWTPVSDCNELITIVPWCGWDRWG